MVVHVAGGFAGRGEIRRRLAGWQAVEVVASQHYFTVALPSIEVRGEK
jgi:hypothetical protein